MRQRRFMNILIDPLKALEWQRFEREKNIKY